jgi:hypothetical protein
MRRAYVTRLARQATNALTPLSSRPVEGYADQTRWLRLLDQHVIAGIMPPDTQRVAELLIAEVLERREEPTHAQLAAALGLGPKTIGRAIRDLRALGLLDWQERYALGTRWQGGVRFPQARLARLIYAFRLPEQDAAPCPIRSLERAWQRLHSCDRAPIGHLVRVPSSNLESYLTVASVTAPQPAPAYPSGPAIAFSAMRSTGVARLDAARAAEKAKVQSKMTRPPLPIA